MNIKSLNFGRNPTGRKQCDWAKNSPPTQLGQNWTDGKYCGRADKEDLETFQPGAIIT